MNTIAAIVFMIGCGALIFIAALTWGFWKACVAILVFVIALFYTSVEMYSTMLFANFINIFTSFFEPLAISFQHHGHGQNMNIPGLHSSLD